MRYQRMIGGFFGALAVLAPATSLADSSGKFSASSAQSFANVDGAVISLQLDKGRKKRLVLVHGTLTTNVTGSVALTAEIQGLQLTPAFVRQTCAGRCSVSATWSLDLDAAEAARPGSFLNLQLFVEIVALSDQPSAGEISFATTMVRK